MVGDSVGDPGVVPTVLLAWGGGASRYLAEIEADELDDLILTSRRSYHLVRQIGGLVSGGLLVYLYMDRARGNLAAARRELGSPRLHDRLLAGANLRPPRALPPARPALAAASGAGSATRASARVAPLAALPSAAAVPWPRTAPGALPRRAATALPPPGPAPVEAATATPPPGMPGSGVTWSNDAGVLRRLLAGLRRLT